MTATTAEVPATVGTPTVATPTTLGRLRVAAASVGAAVFGAAPHVLHHAGPLAGAALFAGVGGTLLFGAIGLAAALPLLVKMRRRSGSWRRPVGALALFTTLFALSSFVVAPALTGAESDTTRPTPVTSPQTSDGEHDGHHPSDRGGE